MFFKNIFSKDAVNTWGSLTTFWEPLGLAVGIIENKTKSCVSPSLQTTRTHRRKQSWSRTKARTSPRSNNKIIIICPEILPAGVHTHTYNYTCVTALNCVHETRIVCNSFVEKWPFPFSEAAIFNSWVIYFMKYTGKQNKYSMIMIKLFPRQINTAKDSINRTNKS